MAPHLRSRAVVRWTTRFSVVLVGLALVGELVVRNFVHAPPERSLDPDFGPGPRPHSLVIESREGFARHRIDSAGRFDRSLSPPVDRRVLLLGDSFSVGQQVAHGERFSERVEEALEGVEVVNHAAPGWYPPYYTAWIRSHDVSRYDAVVIQLSEGDLFELHRPDRVSVEREGDDGWELVMKGFPVRPSRLQQWSRWLSARSALYDFTRQRIRLLAEQERSRLASRLLRRPSGHRRRFQSQSPRGRRRRTDGPRSHGTRASRHDRLPVRPPPDLRSRRARSGVARSARRVPGSPAPRSSSPRTSTHRQQVSRSGSTRPNRCGWCRHAIPARASPTPKG